MPSAFQSLHVGSGDHKIRLTTTGWLVSKGKLDKAEEILTRHHGHIEGYNVHEELVRPSPFVSCANPQSIMRNTIEEELRKAEISGKIDRFAIFKGINGWRLLIALWPKLMQQFVGLTVFNTYSTYFCKYETHSENHSLYHSS